MRASNDLRTTLYPNIEPNLTGMLPVDEIHTLYWEESGNPAGVPVVLLHGGPGAGTNPQLRRFFDPAYYRIILFDQRGAGKSIPHGELRANTTPNLIADIETLRNYLGVEKWLVFGGSWGSTLAIAYAEAHPQRCLGLILRGIFLCRQSEIDWFLYGIRNLFPEPWRQFAEFIPEAERSDLLEAYYKRLIDPDPAIHMPAAHRWSIYEGSCSTLLPSPETVARFGEDNLALGMARIEAHYFKNNIFMPKNALLESVDQLRKIPAVIVQGRYDVVCPIVTADELHQAWLEAEYIIVPNSGHSAMEPNTLAELVGATERFKRVSKEIFCKT
ncbi:prolyl aminopeptidase [Sulfurirhabdus autotrophica]|uniref:Proline iminopeptidase n=1 Tax=Sulfurirhabdus autotrophica TaxID=1706046 RepID=A0A4R3YEG8_9PROT|nr:prolyl aminopeptidase [Sulfurirhabdus autotrophica]TCV89558.1 prolyl aminopeptidase [Sulfurirhabdus autotrophica]